jgi:hypothetical protein
LGIIVFFLGCAITPPKKKEDIENKREFNKSFNTVWEYTIKGLTSSGEKITLIKKDMGLIQVEKEINGCELKKSITNPGFTMWERGEIRVRLFIVEVSENLTRFFCIVDIKGFGKLIEMKRNGKKSLNLFTKEKILSSNGSMEKNFLDLIESFILEKKNSSINLNQ